MSDDPLFDKIVDDVVSRYIDALHGLGQGPSNREWPCPHKNTQLDERNERRFCLDCCHWIEGIA